MKSEWIQFVENLAKERGIKYNEALKIASPLYHKQRGTKPPVKKPKSSGGKKKHSTKDVDNSVIDSILAQPNSKEQVAKQLANAIHTYMITGQYDAFGVPAGSNPPVAGYTPWT